MSEPFSLTLGTAGHIDHGKTALIEALTGVNTDRLPEERARGISIELGFARLQLRGGGALSVVDVPGHERFVRTMVAGATGVDLFLLVVAADDGVMPQTREHLAVLELLEVPAGVVALTKTDLVESHTVEAAAAELRDLLADGPFAAAPIVPVSAVTHAGLAELTGHLEELARERRDDLDADGPARLHVDRCFTLKGIGTVVTGTLATGRVSEGDEVRVEPSSLPARVRSLHVHDERRPSAAAGRRVALNLAGVERAQVRRGDVVVGAGADVAPSYRIDAAVRVLPGMRPLHTGMRVQVHHGTREIPARVALLDGDPLSAGERGLAQLRLERPIVPEAGDRLVLRQVAPPETVGGATVIDPHPRKHGAGDEHVRRLRAMQGDDPLEALRLELESARSGLGREAGADMLDRLVQTGAARRVGDGNARWFDGVQLERARGDVLRALRTAPPGRGVGVGALAEMAALEPQAVSALLEDLTAEHEVERRAGVYALTGPGGDEDPLGRRLADMVAADGLTPRAPDALAEAAGVPRADAEAALDLLAAHGMLVRLRPGVYLSPAALGRARAAVEAACERDGAVTIASLRDALGTSRKYAQAILEHLDAARVTRRVGDQHVQRANR